MFQETSHDFGNVPRGANAVYEFKFTNKYEEDVHVAEVRTSCGCTKPSIKIADLKTYQEGSIICELNTRSYLGSRAAIVTVVFTKPYYGEIQLSVKGTIRSDIDTNPGTVDFGDVDQGTSKTTPVRITYGGRLPWEIKDVRSANQNLGVTIERTNATSGISYLLNVRLKESAPIGEFSDNIVLVTNESNFNSVTIPVRGRIIPPIALPERIDLGTVKVGEQNSSFFVVSGKEPFTIQRIECEDPRFKFTIPEGKKDKHLVQFQFDSGTDPGAFRKSLTVHTDLQVDGTATTIVIGNVSAK